ncbi:MAG: DNA-3-methyladenine glycosylase 2 [Candidatus Accumulibacter phosphatis]|uniref:DNA-3-methyladenine glycosylase II n=1 Tax=Candidatus Accumulibacter phosphatis TaxID=327160 RepID=A0A080LWM7_9PROT|nr:MAG: DNA-3-methyladenine glycosylase 2 [Candidatus Accumulibacter phosphatis]HRE87197.1 AlkA N-terminal domain-containing protein [Accumulibacter sp.]
MPEANDHPATMQAHAGQFTPAACYQAMKAHDTRFDGRFFVGVSSTRIYCRPICRVKLPLFENCSFYISAAAAEAAGYRPCLKCRPELAPGFAASEASAKLAHSAARFIEDAIAGIGGPANGDAVHPLSAIAARVGVTDRHLRRIFQTEFGVSPVQYAQTHRLLLAKRLLTDTALPVAEVAFASGFSSVRRMNALFSERYGFAPTRLRNTLAEAGGASAAVAENTRFFTFSLAYRAPFDWPALLAFLEQRAIAGVEAVSDGSYRRILRYVRGSDAQAICGWLQVADQAHRNALQVTLSPAFAPVIAAVLSQVKRVFDVHADPWEIGAALGRLAQGASGLRLPGAFDGFELAVRAVLGQQITVAAARTLATRFVAAFAEPIEFEDRPPFTDLHVAFPTASRVATLMPAELTRLGIVAARAHALIALAQKVLAGELDLSPDADLESSCAALQSIEGIGAWTAHYIAMRALSWPDAWPPHDAGLLKALGLPNTASGWRAAEAIAEPWRPWRSYALMHLWNSQEKTA